MLYSNPKPDYNSDYSIVYKKNRVARLGNHEIVLLTTDFAAQSHHEIQLMLLAIILGVCGSIIAAWLYKSVGAMDSIKDHNV